MRFCTFFVLLLHSTATVAAGVESVCEHLRAQEVAHNPGFWPPAYAFTSLRVTSADIVPPRIGDDLKQVRLEGLCHEDGRGLRPEQFTWLKPSEDGGDFIAEVRQKGNHIFLVVNGERCQLTHVAIGTSFYPNLRLQFTDCPRQTAIVVPLLEAMKPGTGMAIVPWVCKIASAGSTLCKDAQRALESEGFLVPHELARGEAVPNMTATPFEVKCPPGSRGLNVREGCSCLEGYSGSIVEDLHGPSPFFKGTCVAEPCPNSSSGDSIHSGCGCLVGYSGDIVPTKEAPYYAGVCTPVSCPPYSVGLNVAAGCVCTKGRGGNILASANSPYFIGSCELGNASIASAYDTIDDLSKPPWPGLSTTLPERNWNQIDEEEDKQSRRLLAAGDEIDLSKLALAASKGVTRFRLGAKNATCFPAIDWYSVDSPLYVDSSEWSMLMMVRELLKPEFPPAREDATVEVSRMCMHSCDGAVAAACSPPTSVPEAEVNTCGFICQVMGALSKKPDFRPLGNMRTLCYLIIPGLAIALCFGILCGFVIGLCCCSGKSNRKVKEVNLVYSESPNSVSRFGR